MRVLCDIQVPPKAQPSSTQWVLDSGTACRTQTSNRIFVKCLITSIFVKCLLTSQDNICEFTCCNLNRQMYGPKKARLQGAPTRVRAKAPSKEGLSSTRSRLLIKFHQKWNPYATPVGFVWARSTKQLSKFHPKWAKVPPKVGPMCPMWAQSY